MAQKKGKGTEKEPIFYPDAPGQPVIQYLTSFSSSADIKEKQSAFNRFLFGEEQPLPIVKPYGITIHRNKAYICDTGIGGLIIIDFSEKSFDYFIPQGRGKLQFPINCHLDDDGTLFVADGNRKQIVIFNNELKYINSISLENDSKPTDVFVDDSRIWVSAVDNHKIYLFDKKTLRLISSLPQKDSTPEEYLFQPANMTIYNNNKFVSDIGDCKVKVFDENNKLVRSFGGSGRGFGQFTRPKGIAVAKDGNIYVVDAAFENVQIFDPAGNLLLFFGGTYSGPGGMYLPADVTIDYDSASFFNQFVEEGYKLQYLIFVTNQYGPDKISVYGFIKGNR